MSDPAFTLPLTRELFTSALEKGLGRAMMHVHEYGGGGVEDVIIDCCLRSTAYDPQCEGDRTPWLMQVIEASGAEARIAQQLIARIGLPTQAYWDAAQHCWIARELARRGHAGARERLYESLRKWSTPGDVLGALEIIELEGEPGLMHVADFLGGLAKRDARFWVDELALSTFDERHGEGSARRVLDAASTTSPNIAAFLEHLVERERINDCESANHERRRARMKWPATEVIRHIEVEQPQESRYWYSSWGKRARPDDLQTVFEKLVEEKEPGRLCKYLRVFMCSALPAWDRRLLQFADHPLAEVRSLAHRALSNFAHPDVRHLAVTRIGAGRLGENELWLLQKNYQPGDAAMIEPFIALPRRRDELHHFVMDLTDLFRTQLVPESAALMRFAYQESPCSLCRFSAFSILVDSGTAPDWLVDECRFDSYDETRELASANAPPQAPD